MARKMHANILDDTKKSQTIIHCVHSLAGDVFKHVLDLATHQARQGHKVGLICDENTGTRRDKKHLAGLKPDLALGVMQWPLHRHWFLSDMGAERKIFDFLNRVDILHCHGAKGGAYGRLAAFFINRKRKRNGQRALVAIYTPHGGRLHNPTFSPQGIMSFTFERLMQALTDEFIFVAGDEMETYSRKVAALKRPWTVAFNGLRGQETTRIKASNWAVDFVYAAEMHELKGADLFIDAIELASAKSTKRLRALMVGDGKDLAYYKQEVLRRGLDDIIEFLPPLPAKEVLERARFLVVPSRAEAMPYLVLQALGAQVPIIATNVGGIPEIFGPHRHHLVPAGHAAHLANAMLDRLTRPTRAKDVAVSLRQRVKQHFTAAQMVQKIDEVYARNLVIASANVSSLPDTRLQSDQPAY